jgi:hypothetical protein
MNFNEDYDVEPGRCECGDPNCDVDDNSVELASEACDETGPMIDAIIKMGVLKNGLTRRETHMMVGMILGRMLAQGFKNCCERYSLEDAQRWVAIIMACAAEEVKFNTSHTLSVTVKAQE